MDIGSLKCWDSHPAAIGATNVLINRPIAYMNWDEQSITAACRAVLEDGKSERHAAEQYGIPRPLFVTIAVVTLFVVLNVAAQSTLLTTKEPSRVVTHFW